MIIKSLKLDHFRNYDSLNIDFMDGTTILYGDNAQGKTNILEAIYVAATSKSHKGSKDKEMIQNYPNPFIKETKIKYSIREPSDVVLNIYSLDNRLIFNTNKNNQSSGDYVIDYKPLDLSPGVYVYQLQTKNKLLTGKMIKSQ